MPLRWDLPAHRLTERVLLDTVSLHQSLVLMAGGDLACACQSVPAAAVATRVLKRGAAEVQPALAGESPAPSSANARISGAAAGGAFPTLELKKDPEGNKTFPRASSVPGEVVLVENYWPVRDKSQPISLPRPAMLLLT